MKAWILCRIKQGDLTLFVAILVAALAASPLFLDQGFLNTRAGGDSPFLLFRLHQLTLNLQQGVFPVRWMPDAAYGLGYPFFNFYAALPFYVAAGFRLLGLSYVLSLKLTHFAGFLLAAWAMYQWVLRHTNNHWSALLGSVAYTLAPFHLVNVYVRGDSLSEFWAMAWFPLILLALDKASERLTIVSLVGVSLSFGALVMTHNVSVMLFSPFVALYALMLVVKTSDLRLRRFTLLLAGGILGVTLSAWVWLPALAETNLVQLEVQTTGFLSYEGHFRSTDLIQQSLIFQYDASNIHNSPFSMSVMQVVLVVSGLLSTLVLLVKRKISTWFAGFCLSGLLITTLMITPLSEWFWASIPLLPLAQFPWRFLSVQALFAAVAVSLIVVVFTEQQRTSLMIAGVIILFLFVSSLAGLNLEFIQVRDDDVSAERLQWHESFSGNIGTTIRAEYLPRWTQPRPYTTYEMLGEAPTAMFLTGSGTGFRTSKEAISQVWQLEIEQGPADITLPISYFPGWRAEINGEFLQTSPSNGSGYIQLTVPQGAHHLILKFGRTPVRSIAEILSLVSGIVILIVVLRHWRFDWFQWAVGVSIFFTISTVGFVVSSIPKPHDTSGILYADFTQHVYPIRSNQPFQLGDRAELTAIQVNIEEHTLYYTVRWNTEGSVPVDLILAPPPQQLGPTHHLASFDAHDGTLTGQVDISQIPPGLYFLRIASPEGELTLDNVRHGDLHLQSIVIPSQAIARTGTDDIVDQSIPVQLLDIEATSSVEELIVKMLWLPQQPLVTRYATSLRLINNQGLEWAALDTQTGSSGIYPTVLWQPGQPVLDAYLLNLPAGTPPGDYSLKVRLYDITTLDPVVQFVSDISYVESSPYSCIDTVPLTLLDYMLPETLLDGEPLNIQLDWAICDEAVKWQTIRWELSNAQGIQWQELSSLLPSSDPSYWRRGQFMQGRYQFDLPDSLERDTYDVQITLLDEMSQPINLIELGQVRLEGRQRNFEVPPLSVERPVTFNDEIALLGYNLVIKDGILELELAHQALTDLEHDYTFFVHIINPETQLIVAQIDTMPLNFTYPTSLWIDREVIVDNLEIDLSERESSEYQIVYGWYLPEGDRLDPETSDEFLLSEDRVLLVDSLRMP